MKKLFISVLLLVVSQVAFSQSQKVETIYHYFNGYEYGFDPVKDIPELDIDSVLLVKVQRNSFMRFSAYTSDENKAVEVDKKEKYLIIYELPTTQLGNGKYYKYKLTPEILLKLTEQLDKIQG